MSKKLEDNQKVVINMPFTYNIGERGFVTGKILNTVEDCINETRAEIDEGSLNGYDVFLTVSDN